MDYIKYTAKLDLTDNGALNTGWRIKQGDNGKVLIVIKVVNNNEIYYNEQDIPRIVFHRPDGTSVIGTMSAYSNQSYSYVIVGNELGIAGTISMDVKFANAGRVSTANCIFECVSDTIDADASAADIYPGITLEQIDVEATNIAIEVATTVATEVATEIAGKSKGGIELSSRSPLINTTASNIIGIDVKGKSEQGTTDNLASGNVTTTDIAIYISLGVGTYRVSANGTLTDGNWYVGAWDESGSAITSSAIVADGMALNSTSTWYYGKTTAQTFDFSVKTACRVRIGKLNANNTIPLVVVGITPTPTNPIPIVDASGEIVAKTRNLFDKNNVNVIDNCSIGTVASDGSGTLSTSTNVKLVYIECKPNTTYTISKDVSDYCAIGFTTELPKINVAYKGMNSNRSVKGVTITSTSDAKYMILYLATSSIISSGISYEMIYQSLQVEEGTTATDYVPFESNSITLPITLRSVGNVADTLVINSDGSGKLTQNIERKKFSELGYNAYDSGNTRFVFNVSNVMIAAARTLPMLCDCYTAITDGRTIPNVPTNSIYASGDGTRLYVHDYSTTDGSTLLASIGNMYVYYPLQNPIVTDLTAEQVASILALRTYNGTTIIDSELDVVSVTYSGDVKGYVDDAIAEVNAKDEYRKADVYIGKYYDGSNVYRRIVTFTSGTSGHNPEWMSSIPSGCIPIRWEGVLKSDNGVRYPINYYEDGSNYIATYFNNERIYNKVNGSKFSTKPIEMIVEYLKSNSRMAEPMTLALDEGGITE